MNDPVLLRFPTERHIDKLTDIFVGKMISGFDFMPELYHWRFSFSDGTFALLAAQSILHDAEDE